VASLVNEKAADPGAFGMLLGPLSLPSPGLFRFETGSVAGVCVGAAALWELGGDPNKPTVGSVR